MSRPCRCPIRVAASIVAVTLACASAAAQPEPPVEPPTASPSEEDEAAPPDEPDDAGVPAPSATASMEPRPRTPDDPEPFTREDAPEGPTRKVLVGASVGVEVPSAEDDTASYAPGPAWGAHARVEVAPWMGVRASFLEARHETSIPTGGLGRPGTRFSSPTLRDQRLGVSVEPTWVISPRVRLFGALGVAWSRLSMESVALDPATGAAGEPAGTRLDLPTRKGVSLAYPLALGAQLDAIPNWLALELMVEASLRSNQSGALFETARDVDADGARTTVGPLPNLGPSLGVRMGVSLIP